MTVSIIIAVKNWGSNLKECLAKCQELDYSDFEIIVLPDTEGTVPAESGAQIKIIPTGPVSPAKKRDMALTHASGEILTFIDDDAYPRKDWLKNAVNNFSDPVVAAVGVPAITPPEDSLRQKASGEVYSSPLVSGGYTYRYLPRKRREVDDYPSCNFLVRKSVMQALGGFDTDFWPGEDTKLCLDITKKLGKTIIYDPEVLVYHHRRSLFKAHRQQVASYALHRGYFVKRLPQTSRRLIYFIPSLFLAWLILGALTSVFYGPLGAAYILSIIIYLSLVLIFSLKQGIRFAPWVFCGIILTHLTYGLYFLKGLASNRLKEEA